MHTGKSYREYLEKNYHHVKDDHDRSYWASTWYDLNKLYRSGTAIIMFTGNVMTDNCDVYRTFCIHPVGETFEPYSVAVQVDD